MGFDRTRLKLCFISDISETAPDVAKDVLPLLDAGITSVFLRFRTAHKSARMLDGVSLVAQSCRERGVYCFVFDDPLMALSQDLDGVFFSQPPRNLARIREVLGIQRHIGIQVASEREADPVLSNVTLDLVDFVGIGPVFHRGEKHPDSMGIARAEAITARFGEKPVVWLGGILPETLPRLNKGFADGVAMVRGLSTGAVSNASAYLDQLGAAAAS